MTEEAVQEEAMRAVQEEAMRAAPRVPKREINAEEFDASLGTPNMSSDRGPEVVATALAPQLGSDTNYLAKGEFDMRKLSVITEKDIPLLIYAAIRRKKSPVWNVMFDMYLNLQVSVGGRGRRDIIRMEGVSKGGLPEVQPELDTPGWLSRNVTDRDWRKRAKEESL